MTKDLRSAAAAVAAVAQKGSEIGV